MSYPPNAAGEDTAEEGLSRPLMDVSTSTPISDKADEDEELDLIRCIS
jgi:hypothetical protein